ncbi:MAG: penicillin-binding transpeptidase domain-containing protein [bacterium]
MLYYKNLFFIIIHILLLPVCQIAKAEPSKCVNLVVVDPDTKETITMSGDGQTRETPCSTFKIALSLMGFDAGILKNEHEPKLEYKDEFNAPFEMWKQTQTPQTWIERSCIWYSQCLTAMLGHQQFENYVKNFFYGNQDVSGDPGKNNGLSKAWLCSSLKISLFEQIEFIKKLLHKKLPVTLYAQEQTQNLLYVADLTNGWKLYGKTGSGITRDWSLGWYVGWVKNEEQNKTHIFACCVKSEDNNVVVKGDDAKQEIMCVLGNCV